MAVAGIPRDEDRCCGNTAGIQTGAVGILLGFHLFLWQPHRNAAAMEIGAVGILLGFHLFLRQPHRNVVPMEIGAVGILLGFHLFLRQPHRRTLEILPTIMIPVQALEYVVNSSVRCALYGC